MIREVERKATNGLLVAAVTLVLLVITPFAAINAEESGEVIPGLLVGGLVLLEVLLIVGFFIVQPNQGKALQFFGSYVGTVKAPGLWWANPLFTKKSVSLRIRNFETPKLKVNDHGSSPIEIAAVVVWQVVDTAEALFEVDNYDDYVRVQSESALRGLANQYPYDHNESGTISLSGNTADVAEKLKGEIQDRLSKAGVRVIEARISHLAYAQEIAGAMLRRQQAGAVIAARRQIVDGAVGMVEHALEQLSARKIIQLDDERRAAMVSNLLVVLCAEQPTQPVLNTGTLYS
jgi:regulator of protease activity HflC (stomatin/prohibitin superfamily)